MNIFIGNLSLKITEKELHDLFASYGEITSVKIMNDKYIGSGQSEGYAFVDMPSEIQGKAAITGLNGRIINNIAITVIEALPLSQKKDIGFHGRKGTGRYSGRFSRKVRQRK